MGNSCAGRAGLSYSQRAALMEKYGLTEQAIRRVEEIFKKSTANSRYLTYNDFSKLYSESRFDHSNEDVTAVFKAFAEPSKSGGRITFEGFLRLTLMCSDTWSGDETERMKVLFDVMDTDGSQTISENEFHHFILNFVDDPTTEQKMFDKLDNDNSRAIDFQEFSSFCKSRKKVYRAMCYYVFPIH